MSIWDSIKKTADSMGDAIIAPAGAVWDLASGANPWDDEDFDISNTVMSRGADFLDPLLNEETFSGYGAGKVMDFANATMRDVISEPISTVLTQADHMRSGGSVGDRLSTLFSGDDWQRAYEIAQEQNAGQAFANLVIGSNRSKAVDPFDYDDPYSEVTSKEHPIAAASLSWGANVTGAIALDPFYLGAKAFGLARQGVGPGKAIFGGQLGNASFAKLNSAQRADLGAVLNGGDAKATKRIDRWIDFVSGANPEGRPLTGPEIAASTPELARWSKDPTKIAAFISEAARLPKPAEQVNAIKDILAVAGGDMAALDNLRAGKSVMPAIADQLKNMQRGNVLDLQKLAANPELQFSPMFTQHLERQLANLNSDKGIDTAIDAWMARVDLLEKTHGQMRNLPGLHLGVTGKMGASARGLRVATGKNVVNVVADGAKAVEKTAVTKVDEVTARLASRSSHSMMVQHGLAAVPLLVIKSAAFAAAPYTKFPAAASNAMRQTHFTGVARFDEWDDAVTQFDSMLKMTHAPTLDRLQFISKATLAAGEMEKEMLARQAQRLAMTSYTKHLSAKNPDQVLSEDYITALMENHFKTVGAHMSQMFGRAYAATKMSPEQGDAMAKMAALRQGNISKVEDAATLANSTRPGAQKFSAQADPTAEWRVDHFLDEDGFPVHVPLMESQLSNAVPLLDMHLAKKLVARDQGRFARLGRAWEKNAEEIRGLETKLGMGQAGVAKHLRMGSTSKRDQSALEKAYHARDMLGEAGTKTLRVWKMSVLFRLGYPVRVVLDDHWRIWSRIGAATFYAQNAPEATKNLGYNQVGRYREAGREMSAMRAEMGSLKDELRSDRMTNYAARLESHKKAANSLRSHQGQVAKLRAQEGVDNAEEIARHEKQVARFEAEMGRLQQQMGDVSPEQAQAQLDALTGRVDELNKSLKANVKGNLPEKRHIGLEDYVTKGADGEDLHLGGSFAGPQGRAMYGVTGSGDTFKYQISGIENKTYHRADRGAHATVYPNQPHHLDAWADSLNNQIKNSRVAMHFVNGGDREGFVRWIREPEQADLRRRLSIQAHDAEGWAGRLETMIDDYLPSVEIREALKKGTVTPKWLDKHFAEGNRPAVHGPMVADTIGTSDRSLGIARRINDTFTWIASQPTDRLSRHPFFNSMYKIHAEDAAELRRAAARKTGRKFTQDDLDFIERQARAAALVDLKRTLFDMSAHSHAAHVMRFVSPFFAAHQEVVTRWWRIVQDNPGIVRRAQQAFDAPKHAGLVTDEDGNPVEPGTMPSPKHRLWIPWPTGEELPSGAKVLPWSINENSFNLIVQNGITNPGAGPLVNMPLEWLAAKYPEDEEIARVARLFSPFPPDSPADLALPATFKRLMAAVHGSTDGDFPLGAGEFNDLYATNITDRVVDFRLKTGREPTRSERDEILEDARHESTVEAWLKFANNAGSPFPARPNSRYAAIQSGWYRLTEQGRQKYPDDFIEARDWAIGQFKEKYGEAYLALTYSDVNNPAGVDGSPAEVSAAKKYSSILKKTDKRLALGVMGPAITKADKEGMSVERTDEGRNYFEDLGWIDSDDPEAAAAEAQARRGWQMLDDVTNRLNMVAEQGGLGSYVESEKLVKVRTAALNAIKEENFAFADDIGSRNDNDYNSLLDEMQQLTETKQLTRDGTRTDIAALAEYLELREMVMNLIEKRQAAGLGGIDAAATEPIRQLYTKVVGSLAAKNTFFESGFYTPVIERRDPLLIGLD